MFRNIVIAVMMMIATTGLHAAGMMLALNMIQRLGKHSRLRLQRTRIYRVCGIVLLMFFVSLVEVMAWAATYLVLNALQGFERALYFSMVTFTTLGYGEIVLDERWRLLASFEAANGIIMFGWTTAIVMAAVHRIYFSEKPRHPHPADSGSKQPSRSKPDQEVCVSISETSTERLSD